MSDRVTLPPRAFCRQPGWDAHELAAIRVTTQELDQPGAEIETGWGVSEDGDPWFAVTEAATGETILHLARVNHSFSAIGPALDGALHARDLRTLVVESVRRLRSRRVALSRIF